MAIDLDGVRSSIRRELVAALRSGNYRQGRHVLRSANNQWCPLGIAANLIISSVEFANLGYSWSGFRDPVTNLRCYRIIHNIRPTPFDPTYIPKDVLVLLGFNSFEVAALEALNDTGTPFSTIATLIDEDRIDVPEWNKTMAKEIFIP